jgi:hypothetical protein
VRSLYGRILLCERCLRWRTVMGFDRLYSSRTTDKSKELRIYARSGHVQWLMVERGSQGL